MSETNRDVNPVQRRVPVGQRSTLDDCTRAVVSERRDEIAIDDVGHLLRNVRTSVGRILFYDSRRPRQVTTEELAEEKATQLREQIDAYRELSTSMAYDDT